MICEPLLNSTNETNALAIDDYSLCIESMRQDLRRLYESLQAREYDAALALTDDLMFEIRQTRAWINHERLP